MITEQMMKRYVRNLDNEGKEQLIFELLRFHFDTIYVTSDDVQEIRIMIEEFDKQYNSMKIEPLPSSEGGCNFELVELADKGNIGRLTPHCKIHGSMNKVSLFDNGGGFWRCLQGQCRAGCIEKRRD